MATNFLPLLAVWVAAAAVSGSYLTADEASCDFGKLPCDSGQCVPRTSWCDGAENCDDTSDEMYCRQLPVSADSKDLNVNNCVKSRHFRCDDGLCLPRAARCDDLPDCQNGEDEEGCDYSYESLDDGILTTVAIEVTTATTNAVTQPTTEAPPKPPQTRGDVSSVPGREEVLARSVRYVIEARDSHWGWGQSTARMATALYLANQSYFLAGNHDGLLTQKQLEVELALDLMRHPQKPLRLHEISHYIHALMVTCQDPRDFHGVNVVKMLKREMAERRSRGLFLSPLGYLALCNAGDFSDAYIKRLKNMAYRRSEEHRWLDIQAYALLAISCRSHRNTSFKEWDYLKKDVAKNISDWQQPDGSFGSVYSTGLALQALIAANDPGTEPNRQRALAYLRARQDWQGSFGGELDNYYVLPALNLRSLAAVRERACPIVPHDTQSTEQERSDRKRKRMQVHYSLWIGGEKSEIHTITLSLPRHSNFLEIMDAAEKINPRYKYEMWTPSRGGGPVVNAVAGRWPDVERATYWTLYRRVPLPFRPPLTNGSATVARLKLLGAKRWVSDLRKLYPKDGEHLAFWYKPYM